MRWLLPLLLLLSACGARDAYVRSDVHTGVTVSASAAYVKVLDRVTTVEARVARLSMGADERFVIKTFVVRNDLNYPKITAARSFGQVLPYQRDDRSRVGVLRAEVGHIPLTREQVTARSVTGYSFQLSGPRGRYDFNIPGDRFAAALKVPP